MTGTRGMKCRQWYHGHVIVQVTLTWCQPHPSGDDGMSQHALTWTRCQPARHHRSTQTAETQSGQAKARHVKHNTIPSWPLVNLSPSHPTCLDHGSWAISHHQLIKPHSNEQNLAPNTLCESDRRFFRTNPNYTQTQSNKTL